MISLEQRRSTYSAIIDGMYCSFLLKYGLIGSGSYLLGGFIVLFWTDFHFYVTHRLMHMSTFLYKNVHYIHHQSHNPNVWSSLSFHPVEAFIFFSAYLIVLIVPMPTVVWSWPWKQTTLHRLNVSPGIRWRGLPFNVSSKSVPFDWGAEAMPRRRSGWRISSLTVRQPALALSQRPINRVCTRPT